MEETMERAPVHLCDVCLQTFSDVSLLTQQLQTEHGLAGITFNVARDSLDSQAACAHCGTTYSSMESLRSHISQGRCAAFNPAATAETSQVSQAWLDICLNGDMFKQSQLPMERLHLSIRCKQCQQVYKRSSDLANHLMTSHARLWRQAQGLTLLLVELVFARHGCVCNPQIHQVRQSHVCLPLRQIAMMYHRLDKVPFMPIQLSEGALQQLVHPTIPRPLRFRVMKLFSDRTFHDMWTDPEVMQMLSNACIMCGQAHHPGLLCRHLHEAHTCGHQFADFYNETLMPVFQAQMASDYHCDYCKQYFNMPLDSAAIEASEARQLLVQVHLQGNCPVLLQTALLLGTALNGGRLGYEWLGRADPDRNQGDVFLPCSSLRQELEAATKPSGTETAQDGGSQQGRQARSRSTRPPVQRHHGMPKDPGPAGSASRAQSELAAKHRLFRAVLPTGPIGHPPGLAEGNTEVAAASTEEPRGSASTVETAPASVADEGTPDQSTEGLGEQAWRRTPADLLGPEGGVGGHELAFSQMGSSFQSPDDRQEEGSVNEEDAGTLGGAMRGHAASSIDCTPSGPANDLCTDCDSLEAPDQHEARQDLRSTGGLGPQFSLATGRNVSEAASAQAVIPCQLPVPGAIGQQGPGQGQTEREDEGQINRFLTAKKVASTAQAGLQLAVS